MVPYLLRNYEVCDFLVDCLPDEVAELVSYGAGESADNFVEGGWGGRFT